MSKGIILNTKQFEIHDGPGMRTTLFVKGCPLRCNWCHNPESFVMKTQLAYYEHKCTLCGKCAEVCPNGVHVFDENHRHRMNREACTLCGKCAEVCPNNTFTMFGKEVTPNDILPELLEDKIFFDASGGGVTISGGEPLMQADFTVELLKLLKENGVHTAVDTCLFASREALDKVMPYADMFLIDVKAIDEDVHKRCTGVSNKQILENLRYIDSLVKPYEIRIPFVPGQNDGEIPKIAVFLSSLTSMVGVRVLPYHNLSGAKYNALEIPYKLTAPIPTEEEVEAARGGLESHNLKVLR